MSLNAEDLQRAAKLARLSVEDDQIEEQLSALNSVMGLISAMETVDCANVEPMSNPLLRPQPLRKDVVTEDNQRAFNQNAAPQVDSGFYLVPKVLD